jgi:hypothetical protein
VRARRGVRSRVDAALQRARRRALVHARAVQRTRAAAASASRRTSMSERVGGVSTPLTLRTEQTAALDAPCVVRDAPEIASSRPDASSPLGTPVANTDAHSFDCSFDIVALVGSARDNVVVTRASVSDRSHALVDEVKRRVLTCLSGDMCLQIDCVVEICATFGSATKFIHVRGNLSMFAFVV